MVLISLLFCALVCYFVHVMIAKSMEMAEVKTEKHDKHLIPFTRQGVAYDTNKHHNIRDVVM